ncbi:MAG: hypothetical protein IJ316_04985 [Clostridia bacterium]|nr:hypothetical protein [Clostridia bacterium]
MRKRIISTILALAIALILCLQAVPVMAEHTKDSSYIYDFWGNANQSLSAFQLATVIDKTSMADLAENHDENLSSELPLSGVKDIFVYEEYEEVEVVEEVATDVVEEVATEVVEDSTDVAEESTTEVAPQTKTEKVLVEREIYVVDSVAGRVNIFTDDYKLRGSIRIIRDAEGKIVVSEETNKQMLLSGPEGVYVTKEYIYIADTGNERILQLQRKAPYSLVKEITRPSSMVGDSLFKPSKIAVDNSGRIFVVVQNSTEGIIELNSDGSFSRYYGVNSPTVNLIDYFWKSLASEEQQETMSKVYAPAFSNLHVDKDGFVYAVTVDTASQEMVFRFNSNGENVLRKFGYSEQLGDLPNMLDESFTMSTFIDIAVNDYGVYAILDTAKKRVFVYNFDGNLLSIFGGSGSTKGTFVNPTSITWMGNDLIVGDEDLKSAFVFKTTDFGELILSAEEKYFTGDFDGAAELYRKAVEMNANYDHAYVAIGKNLLMQDEYEQAMHYFKLGNDKTYYSTAFMGYRNLVLQKYFWILAIVIVAFIWWVLRGEVKYNKQQRKLEEL